MADGIEDPIYEIVNWDKLYENNRSRQIDNLNWISQPNKHDSLGFRMLMRKPNGLALYGAWCLIVQVASKCQPRGILAKDGNPVTPEVLSILTGAPVDMFRECLAVAFRETKWIQILASERQVGVTWVSDACDARARVLSLPSSSSSLPSSSFLEGGMGGTNSTLVGECAERMYAMHPKKKNLVLVAPALVRAVNGTANLQGDLIEIEQCHAAWCKSDQWGEKGGRFAPKLDEWIADRGFSQWPNGKNPKKITRTYTPPTKPPEEGNGAA